MPLFFLRCTLDSWLILWAMLMHWSNHSTHPHMDSLDVREWGLAVDSSCKDLLGKGSLQIGQEVCTLLFPEKPFPEPTLEQAVTGGGGFPSIYLRSVSTCAHGAQKIREALRPTETSTLNLHIALNNSELKSVQLSRLT